MDAELYRRAGDVFDAALDLPREQRRAFLDEACQGDDELRLEVERLIAHDLETTGLLDRPALIDADSHSGDLETGTRLGSYRVDQVIGRGGMGVVYRATRDDDEFHHRVAIKVVAGGGLRARDAWRFHRERQILARLEHPNIARLYDGGTTDGDQPYLVLEYVDGPPLTDFCDQQRLSVGRRIELFLQVCSAVQFAHRNLVVHRDLKPSNILVDAEGVPKLLDFGIAKLLAADAESAAAIQATEDHQRILTLSHASPEQVLGQAITTATDVYCLGLVLYELLCGVSPFAEPSRTPYELIRRIQEFEPPRPSQALGTAEDHNDPEADGLLVAERRSASSLPTLRNRLRGDLDTIVTKALSKEPELRYATAAELADDLERHLDNRPILAGSPGLGYRLRKFLRRHRAPMLVAAISLLVIIGVVGGFIGALFDQVERTEQEKVKAERLVTFLTETFAVANPDESIGETVTARELLDAGAQRIATELQEQPEAQSMMLDAMGQIYQQIGLLEPALDLLQQAVERRSTTPQIATSDLAESLTHLGATQRAAGLLEEAEVNLRHAIALGAELGSNDQQVHAAAIEALALLMRELYRYDESEALYVQALAILKGSSVDLPRLAQVQSDYGILLRESGRFEASRHLHESALELRRSYFGETHPRVADSLEDLATLDRFLGRFGPAEETFRKALAIRLEVHGPRHKDVADTMDALALMLGDQGRNEEAVAMFREVVEINEELSGKNPEYATMANNLAIYLADLEQYEESERIMKEVLDIRIRALGERHPFVGLTILTLGRVYHRQGKLDLAEEHYRRAAAFGASLPQGHRARAYPDVALAWLLNDRGQGAEAEAILRPALEELATSHTPGHWRIAMALANLGLARGLQNDPTEARQHLRQALEYLEAAEDDDPARRSRVRGWLEELPSP